MTGLAERAQLTIENGVAVDERLRTSDPDIFAAGDCCSFPLAFMVGDASVLRAGAMPRNRVRSRPIIARSASIAAPARELDTTASAVSCSMVTILHLRRRSRRRDRRGGCDGDGDIGMHTTHQDAWLGFDDDDLRTKPSSWCSTPGLCKATPTSQFYAPCRDASG